MSNYWVNRVNFDAFYDDSCRAEKDHETNGKCPQNLCLNPKSYERTGCSEAQTEFWLKQSGFLDLILCIWFTEQFGFDFDNLLMGYSLGLQHLVFRPR